MQQRQLRLGDVLDDYCTRERRITNHVVVAMIEDAVKQTRCSTCDAEHEYKQARVPSARRRKGDVPAAHLVEGAGRPVDDGDVPDEVPALDDGAVLAEAEPVEPGALSAAPESAGPSAGPAEAEEARPEDASDEWPVHRPLIRAQLPRPEGVLPERKPTDFTSHSSGGRFDANRNNGQRHRGHRPGRQAQGGQHSQSGQGSRFGGPRGQGGFGQGGGQPGQRPGNRSGEGGGNRAGQSQGQGQGQGRGSRPGGGRRRGR